MVLLRVSAKGPGQVVLPSEALRFYKVTGPGSSGGREPPVQLNA